MPGSRSRAERPVRVPRAFRTTCSARHGASGTSPPRGILPLPPDAVSARLPHSFICSSAYLRHRRRVLGPRGKDPGGYRSQGAHDRVDPGRDRTTTVTNAADAASASITAATLAAVAVTSSTTEASATTTWGDVSAVRRRFRAERSERSCAFRIACSSRPGATAT